MNAERFAQIKDELAAALPEGEAIVFSRSGYSLRQIDALENVAEAAKLIRAYDQAGGNEWREAHAKLYLALDALESGPEGGEGG